MNEPKPRKGTTMTTETIHVELLPGMFLTNHDDGLKLVIDGHREAFLPSDIIPDPEAFSGMFDVPPPQRTAGEVVREWLRTGSPEQIAACEMFLAFVP